MTVQIANGNGTMVGITSGARIMGIAPARNLDLACALEEGWAFTCTRAAVTPTAALERTFCKIANISADPLIISRIVVVDAAAEVIRVRVSPDYVGVGTTASVAVNRQIGSPNLFTAKGTHFYGAAIITLPATAAEIHRFTTAIGVEYILDLSGAPIILGPNTALTLASMTSGAALTYAVDCCFAMVPRNDS
jgi:hypothetical protein